MCDGSTVIRDICSSSSSSSSSSSRTIRSHDYAGFFHGGAFSQHVSGPRVRVVVRVRLPCDQGYER